MKMILVDPVLISRGGRTQSQTSSGASSPKQATLSPTQSPSKSSTNSTTQSTTTKTTMDMSSSLTTMSGNLLKAAIAKSLTEKSPEEKVIEPSSLFFTNFVALSGGGLQERTSNSG